MDLAHPGRTEAFALEREERELVGRIQQAEVARELEAVDDLRLPLEADVLRPQVAVGLDDVPAAYPLVEQCRRAIEKGALPRADGLDHRGRQPELRRAQLPQILGDALPRSARGTRVGRHRDRRAPAVEPAERRRRRARTSSVVHRAARISRSSIRSAGSRRILTSQSTTRAVGSEPQLSVGVDGQRHGFEIDVVASAGD